MTLTPFTVFMMGDDSLQQKVFIDVTFSHDTNPPAPLLTMNRLSHDSRRKTQESSKSKDHHNPQCSVLCTTY